MLYSAIIVALSEARRPAKPLVPSGPPGARMIGLFESSFFLTSRFGLLPEKCVDSRRERLRSQKGVLIAGERG